MQARRGRAPAPRRAPSPPRGCRSPSPGEIEVALQVRLLPFGALDGADRAQRASMPSASARCIGASLRPRSLDFPHGPETPRPDFSSLGELNVVSNPVGGHASPSEVMYPGGPQTDGGLLAPGDPVPENAGPGGRRPEWLKVRHRCRSTYANTKHVLRDEALNTVCEEARCPNIGECWALGTATFMILGSVCTRNCGFCAIDTGRPPITDLDEPRRVAEAMQADGPEACRGHDGRPRRPARRRRGDGGRDDPPDPARESRDEHRGADQRPQRPRHTTSAPSSRRSPTS